MRIYVLRLCFRSSNNINLPRNLSSIEGFSILGNNDIENPSVEGFSH